MYDLPNAIGQALNMLTGGGHEAFVVGGAVRDLLCGAPVHDWDIATSALPEQTAAVFSQYRVIETGLKHGTLTVLMDGLPLEITTYRKEGTYSDHRRPDRVIFTERLEEDLARRDLTVNAMAYHPDVGVVDPFGGQEDLKAGVLRCVGDPDRRFREDALRMLRVLRFASVLGMEPEAETARAVHRSRELLAYVAAERVRAELTGMLLGERVRWVLEEYSDVLCVPIPELAPMVGQLQYIPYHCYDVWGHCAAAVEAMPPDPVLRWSALLHDCGKPAVFTQDETGRGHFYDHAAVGVKLAEGILRRLRFDNETRKAILFVIAHHHPVIPPTREEVRKAVQEFGVEGMERLICMFRADTMGKSELCRPRLEDSRELERLLAEVKAGSGRLTVRDLAVDGRDMMELGLRGREIGAELERLVDEVALKGLNNTRETLLQSAGEHLKHI